MPKSSNPFDSTAVNTQYLRCSQCVFRLNRTLPHAHTPETEHIFQMEFLKTQLHNVIVMSLCLHFEWIYIFSPRLFHIQLQLFLIHFNINCIVESCQLFVCFFCVCVSVAVKLFKKWQDGIQNIDIRLH